MHYRGEPDFAEIPKIEDNDRSSTDTLNNLFSGNLTDFSDGAEKNLTFEIDLKFKEPEYVRKNKTTTEQLTTARPTTTTLNYDTSEGSGTN